MPKCKLKELRPHPQNQFFFDDIDGQKAVEFDESLKTSGIIESLVLTDFYGEPLTIVSGNQRMSHGILVGIEEAEYVLRHYETEDQVIKDLIETNIRQRGNINSSELKMGRIIKELERIYGVKCGRGGDTTSNPQLADCKTQGEIAAELDMSVDKASRLKKLTELPPEYQELLLTGNISTDTANSILSKLTEDELSQLLTKLPMAQKITKAQVQTEVDKIKGQFIEELDDANERIKEAQSLIIPQDEDYVEVASQRDKYKDESRKWYEETAQERKARADAERKLKAKEQEAADLARRLEKAAQKAEPKEVIKEVVKEVEVVPEKYLKMEVELKKAKEQIESMQNQNDVSDDPKVMRVFNGGYTPSDYAATDAQDLQEVMSNLLSLSTKLAVEPDTCNLMPDKYKDIIAHQWKDLTESMVTILTYFEKGDIQKCKTA